MGVPSIAKDLISLGQRSGTHHCTGLVSLETLKIAPPTPSNPGILGIPHVVYHVQYNAITRFHRRVDRYMHSYLYKGWLDI